MESKKIDQKNELHENSENLRDAIPLAFKGNDWLEMPLPLVYLVPGHQMFSLPFLSSSLKEFIIGIQVESTVYTLKQLCFHGTEFAEEIMNKETQRLLAKEENFYLDFPTLDHMWSIWENREAFGRTVRLLQFYGVEADGLEDVFYLTRDYEVSQEISGDCVNPLSGEVIEADVWGFYRAFCEIKHKSSNDYIMNSFVDANGRVLWREFFLYFSL